MTPQPQQHDEVCAEEDFCKGCDNFDGFHNSCKLAQYKTSIQGTQVWIAPRTNGTRWLLKSVGCASDTRSRPHTHTPSAPSERIGPIRTNVFMDEDKVWLIERVNAGMGEHEYVISYLGDHFATVPSEVIAREIVEMQCHTCPVFTPEHDATIRNQTLSMLSHEIEQAPEDEHDEGYWRAIEEVQRIIDLHRTPSTEAHK